MEAFYESEHLTDLKYTTRVLTEELGSQEKEGAFSQATMAGNITLSIRDYGRGTDFKVGPNNKQLDLLQIFPLDF